MRVKLSSLPNCVVMSTPNPGLGIGSDEDGSYGGGGGGDGLGAGGDDWCGGGDAAVAVEQRRYNKAKPTFAVTKAGPGDSPLENVDPSAKAAVSARKYVGVKVKQTVQQAPDLICGTGTHYRIHPQQQPPPSSPHHSPVRIRIPSRGEGSLCYSPHSREDMTVTVVDPLREPTSSIAVMGCEPDHQHGHSQISSEKSNRSDEMGKLDTFFNSSTVIDQAAVKGAGSLTGDKSHPSSHGDGDENTAGNEQLGLGNHCSSLSPFKQLKPNFSPSPGDNADECVSVPVREGSSSRSSNITFNLAHSGGRQDNSGKIHFVSYPQSYGRNKGIARSLTPNQGDHDGGPGSIFPFKTHPTLSPNSYVTKLTMIPVEQSSETCFLSVRSITPPFGGEGEFHQDTDHHHPLLKPGASAKSQEEGEGAVDLDGLGLSCQVLNDSVSSSNTPVMPRFSSSGTVVFPLRKAGWEQSAELLSQTTPESSVAGGRLSPTPSEASRTESALAPPPPASYASQNSEASKTESARGQSSIGEPAEEEDDDEETYDLNPHSDIYTNDGRGRETSTRNNFGHIPQPAPSLPPTAVPDVLLPPFTESSNGKDQDGAVLAGQISATDISTTAGKQPSSSSPFAQCLSKWKKNEKKYLSARDMDHDEDNNNTLATTAPVLDGKGGTGTSGIRTGVDLRSSSSSSSPIRSPLSTAGSGGISSGSSGGYGFGIKAQHQYHYNHPPHKIKPKHHQRLPKGHRGQSRPWYEIECSDDEGGSLLQVAKSRSGYSSKFSSSSSTQTPATTTTSTPSSSSSSALTQVEEAAATTKTASLPISSGNASKQLESRSPSCSHSQDKFETGENHGSGAEEEEADKEEKEEEVDEGKEAVKQRPSESKSSNYSPENQQGTPDCLPFPPSHEQPKYS